MLVNIIPLKVLSLVLGGVVWEIDQLWGWDWIGESDQEGTWAGTWWPVSMALLVFALSIGVGFVLVRRLVRRLKRGV